VVKLIAFLKRRPDLTYEQFVDHWSRVHGPLVVECLPGLRRYIQNPVVQRPGREWPYDGVSELWFDSYDDFRAAFRSPSIARVKEDEPKFVYSFDWMVVTENAVLDPGSGPA